MRHLFLCREYPPAPAGGIGRYVEHVARLLAEAGETVHVIGQRWAGADIPREVRLDGRLMIHRVPYDDWNALLGARPHPELQSGIARGLFRSSLPPQAFAWEAGLLAERLIEEEAIDIIEAQEYEAPLYFFMLRRALGLGPGRQPPCIVHLHSPTEFIARHNEWDPIAPFTLLSTRLERASMDWADALLCPSNYLARRVETRLGLRTDTITVIPLPSGGQKVRPRSDEVWRTGSILYVGRLERRKGVLEWIDAAVQVATDRSDVQFEFVGANVLGTRSVSARDVLRVRIPRELRSRFIFHGHADHVNVRAHLAGARIAVVPSRWENFPYTCIEAMASGLPVLASREGGMAEMIEHGSTGWLSAVVSPAALAATLTEALATGPATLAQMGASAAASISAMCDDARVIERQLAFRDRIRERGVLDRSRLHFTGTSLAERRAAAETVGVTYGPWQRKVRRIGQTTSGIACIVLDTDDDAGLERTCASLAAQSERPAAVIVARVRPLSVMTASGMLSARPDPGTHRVDSVLHSYDETIGRSAAMARSRAVSMALDRARTASGAPAQGIAFLDAGLTLDSHFIESCARLLSDLPAVGVVSGWTWTSRDRLHAPAQPTFPYQFMHNDIGPAAVVRTEAFIDVGGFREGVDDGFEDWDLFNAVMANGWIAVTVPVAFASGVARAALVVTDERLPQRALLERFPELVARDAFDLAILAAAAIKRTAAEPDVWSPPTLRDVIGFAVRHPLQTVMRLRQRIGEAVKLRAQNRNLAGLASSARGSVEPSKSLSP